MRLTIVASRRLFGVIGHDCDEESDVLCYDEAWSQEMSL